MKIQQPAAHPRHWVGSANHLFGYLDQACPEKLLWDTAVALPSSAVSSPLTSSYSVNTELVKPFFDTWKRESIGQICVI